MRLVVLPCLVLATVVAQTPLRLELVTGGLQVPVLAVSPPGDVHRLFVVEAPGRIRIVRDGVLLPTPFLDLTTDPTFVYAGEAGLLGLAFHPNYASNRQFFVFHSGPPWLVNHLRRFTASALDPDVADAASSQTLLSLTMVFGNHNGGMLAFGGDGYLYVGVGDGGSTGPAWPDDPQNHAQRADSLLGKLLRLDVDNPQAPLPYGIPASNPFASPGGPRDEIWAFGVRNPWRFSFDRLTHDLWLADVGGTHEEIDFEPAGAPGGRNYGWSCMAGTYCNAGSTVCVCNAPALTPPLHDYPWGPNGQAIIGGFVYRGAAIPDLRGTYFFADFIRVELWSLRRTPGGATAQLTNRTAELAPPAPLVLVGPTGFGEDAVGELYVCDFAGKLYRIAPATPTVVGVTPYGAGTPGCTGAHTLGADSSAVVGHPAFTLRAAQAPASGVGLLAFATQADVAGSDPFGLGFVLHVQLPSLLSSWTVLADASGVGTFAFAIPPSPLLTGFALQAQVIWLWNPATCSPSPYGWSSSPGLQFVVQP